MFGTLYIIATPIGNLEDITLRALRILKEVDVVVCEDTRVTRKLLSHYDISKPTQALHQHSRKQSIERALQVLAQGKDVAYATDAGTPGVSDPGPYLVASVRERFGDDISIVPIPGSSAVTALASIASFPMDEFCFFGYPPHKKGRKTFFGRVAACEVPALLFESPHRIQKTMRELRDAAGETTQAIIGRELTKKFETVYRGTLGELCETIEKEKPRGEYVVLIERV